MPPSGPQGQLSLRSGRDTGYGLCEKRRPWSAPCLPGRPQKGGLPSAACVILGELAFPVSRKIKLSTQEKYLSSSIWVAMTKYHRWECLNNRHLFLTALEMRSTKSRCQQGRLHLEVSLLDLQAATTLLCAHMISFLCTCREREEERARSLVSFLVRPLILPY